MLNRIWAALSDRKHHLEAIRTEEAVRDALREEGHHVTELGLWALRHQQRHKDVLFATLTMKKGWSWLVFSAATPFELAPLDQQLLVRLLQDLHGVQLIHWRVQDQTLSYQHWNLSVAQVGHRKILNQSAGKIVEVSLSQEGIPLPQSLLSLGEQRLLATLVEVYYVDHVAAGRQGDFTNIDVLALVAEQPVVIEVKRRTRAEEEASNPLTLSLSQGQTLVELNRQANCEVHVVLLTVPSDSGQAQWLTEGTWHSCGIKLQREWTRFLLQVHHPLPALTLTALRENRQLLLFPEIPVLPSPTLPPQSSSAPIGSTSTRLLTTKQSSKAITSKLKSIPTLRSYTEQYAFLDVWSPVTIKLQGVDYPSLAVAYLAAHTTDPDLREALAITTRPGDALNIARRLPIREDWAKIQEEAAWRITVAAFRHERGPQLVATLPFRLLDETVTDPLLKEIQGRAGNQSLERLREILVRHQPLENCCPSCIFAQPAKIAGFVECHHAGGTQAARECIGKQAYWYGSRQQAVSAMTTRGGKYYQARQTAEPEVTWQDIQSLE